MRRGCVQIDVDSVVAAMRSCASVVRTFRACSATGSRTRKP